MTRCPILPPCRDSGEGPRGLSEAHRARYGRLVATFKVCFDGKWQGDFDDRQEALAWGREVGETGRLVQVAQVRRLDLKLIAVFPEDGAEEESVELEYSERRVAWRTAIPPP